MIECTFIPQVWVKDSAMEVDPEGPVTWLMQMSEVTALTGVTDMSKMDDDPFARDELRWAKGAPQWVKDWAGPFEVEWRVLA